MYISAFSKTQYIIIIRLTVDFGLYKKQVGVWILKIRAKLLRHCLRVRYRTSRLRGYGSGTGYLDTDSRGSGPDTEPRLWGLSRGPVVCETTTDKSRNTGPYLHVYVVTVILPAKTHVEVSLCFVRHLWFSKGNQSVFTVMRHTIQTIKLIQKVYK